MDKEDANKLINWLLNFKEFSTTLLNSKLRLDITKFEKLSSEFKSIQNEIEINGQKDSPEFNIFYLIKNCIDKEVTTHSPILADLLNINGKHNQGRLFYNEFLKQIGINDLKIKFKPDEKMFFFVTLEKSIGNGFIDIFIEYTPAEQSDRFAIAIENKINAGDQPGQLDKYAKYLEREFKENFLLLYLTPQEREPERPYSIEENRYKDFKNRGLLKLITYKKDISLLLENTYHQIQSENVKLITNQYLQIIKNNFAMITETYNDKMYEFLTNAENYKAAKDLSNNLENVNKRLKDEFKEEVIKLLRMKTEQFQHMDDKSLKFITKNEDRNCRWFEIKNDDWEYYYISTEGNDVGIRMMPDKRGELACKENFIKQEIENRKEVTGNFGNLNWIVWETYTKYAFQNNDEIIRLLPSVREKIIIECSDEIFLYVEKIIILCNHINKVITGSK